MPPEPSRSKLKRKTSLLEKDQPKLRFEGGRARETEQKRNQGRISCAECSRQKIKCDKQIPCNSCQKRGCTALCPNGSLSSGQRTRFVLEATEHLHRRITKMGERIRQLEDALGELQSQRSSHPHPLLREGFGVNQFDESLSSPDEPGTPIHPLEILDTFGTLSITDHGISRFFGPTGGSECLLMSDKLAQQDRTDTSTPDSSRDAEASALPQELRFFSQAFPFTPMGPTAAICELIEGHLPSWERASYLTQTYYQQAGWLFHGVSKDQIIDELLPKYYSNGPPKAIDEDKSPHELALLFLIFAIGALVDLTLNPANAEAEHYHQIAHATICLRSVFENPSLATIQALRMFGIYNAMSGNELSAKETSMETTWSLTVLAAHLSQTIGLHRDSARWGLAEKMVQLRRTLFWDLFAADAWHSLNTGRPPSFSLSYIDSRFPGSEDDGEEKTDLHSEFKRWWYRFARECVAEVATRTLTVETPSYATIVELDRKVREFPVPDEAVQVAMLAVSPMQAMVMEDLPIHQSMGRLTMANAREIVLLYLHRSFFAQAVIKSPINPLESQYAPSFLATYRASSTILQTIGAQYALYPELCSRFWILWMYAFSAAVVFGTIVTRGPRSPLAPSAIKELNAACVLFTKAAAQSRRAAKALPILTKLSEKAHNALVASQTGKLHGQLGQQWSIEENDDDDELCIFAGKTRFVSARRLPSTSLRTLSNNTHPSSEFLPQNASDLDEQQPTPPQLYQPEGSGSSSSRAVVNQCRETTTVTRGPQPPEWEPLQYPTVFTEYANAGMPPPVIPQHHSSNGSLESAITATAVTPPLPPGQAHEQYLHWSSQLPLVPLSSQFSSSMGHPTNKSGPGHGPPVSERHECFYHLDERWTSLQPPDPSTIGTEAGETPRELTELESMSQEGLFEYWGTMLQVQQSPPTGVETAGAGGVPTELSELGLVSRESGHNEMWTSFMRDSGYFEGIGY